MGIVFGTGIFFERDTIIQRNHLYLKRHSYNARWSSSIPSSYVVVDVEGEKTGKKRREAPMYHLFKNVIIIEWRVLRVILFLK